VRIAASRPIWRVTVPAEGFFAAGEGSRLAVFNSKAHEVAIHDGSQRWDYCRLEVEREPTAVVLSGLLMYSFSHVDCIVYDLTTGAVVLKREVRSNAATRLGPKHAALNVSPNTHVLIQLSDLAEVGGRRFSCDSYHYCASGRRYVGVDWTEANSVDLVLFNIRQSFGAGKVISVPIPSPGLEEHVMFHDHRLRVESIGRTRSVPARPYSWTMLGMTMSWLNRGQGPDAHGWIPVRGISCSVKSNAQDPIVLFSSLGHRDVETLHVPSGEEDLYMINSSKELRPMRPRLFIN
jgi:hypothetical protein